MRKIRKRKKIRIYRVFLYFVLFLSMALAGNYAYSKLITGLDINGISKIEKTELGFACDANVTYEIQMWPGDTWGTTYRILFTLTNKGIKTYTDWHVNFDIPDDADAVFNSSSEMTITGTKLRLESLFYNSIVAPGESVVFEVQLTTNNTNYEPSNITVNNCYEAVDNEGVHNELNIEYKFVQRADFYVYQYDIIVTNNANYAINNLSFSINKPSNGKIINIWNANYISKDNSIEFSNVTYNGNLEPGESATFGVMIGTDDAYYVPSTY